MILLFHSYFCYAAVQTSIFFIAIAFRRAQKSQPKWLLLERGFTRSFLKDGHPISSMLKTNPKIEINESDIYVIP